MYVHSNYIRIPITVLYTHDGVSWNNSVVYENTNITNNIVDNTIPNGYNYPYIPITDVEYLTVLDKIHITYQNSDSYDNILYVIGTMISLYSIYYFIVETIESYYKKMNL
jgi:hypothetical protein